jgi:glycosyltransferase involved in cell wall biosynthesis
MEKTFDRTKKSFVLNNSTQATSSDAGSDELLPQQVVDVFNSPEKILLFHGVLSDLRGLSKFVKIFEDTPDLNWKLVLIGYNPGDELLKVMRKAKKTFLLSAVSGTMIKKVVGMSDLVLMAYPVSDINTKYGFANKLGDCIAEKVPFLYNKELEAIDDVAQKTNSGISFLWPELTFPGKLQSLLDEVENMSADWERAEEQFGWENFQQTVSDLLTEIRIKL